jgi:hypothetical protein
VLLRNIGKLVRGKSTPFQVFTAAVLGSALAFLPGFQSAPGLYVALGLLLFVLNTNLFIAGLVAIPAKLAAMALLDQSLRLGERLLHGGSEDLFRQIVNAPVLHYFGLQRYLVTGSFLLGLLFGVLIALPLVLAQKKVRRNLAALELKNEKFNQATSKGWVKFASWLFLGGKANMSYEELNKRNVGNPVRIAGLIVVVLAVAAVWFLQKAAGSPYVANALQTTLARANGATVELGGFKLDLQAARLKLANLEVVDPDDLMTDLLRGVEFDADVSSREVLRGRFVVDKLTVREASTGARREQPGERVEGSTSTAEEAGPIVTVPDISDYSMEEVLAEAEKVKAQLEKLREWMRRLAPEDKPKETDGGPADESLHERLERMAKQLGYSNLVAEHLLESLPRLEIRELSVEGFKMPGITEQPFTLVANNLSSAPGKQTAPPTLSLVSKDKKLSLNFTLGTAASIAAGGAPGLISLEALDFPVDSLAQALSVDGKSPISGGTLSFDLNGAFSPRDGSIDLPLAVTLKNSNLTVPGVGTTPVENFAIPIGLRGPIDNLRVQLDDDQLVAALVAAGKAEFAGRVRKELDQRIGDAKARARQALEARFGDQIQALGLDLNKLENIEDFEDVTEIGTLVQALAADKVEAAKAEIQGKVEETVTNAAEDALQKAAADLLQGQKPSDPGQSAIEEAKKAAEEAKKGLGDLFKKKP